jgi:uncharacterized protein (DUF1015 family)
MGTVDLNGVMGLLSKEISTRIKLKERDYLYGQMVKNMMGIGMITKCQVKEYIHGLVVKNMKDHIKMIK